MRIQVTEDDIKRGVRYSCSLCPIARAIRRATGQHPVILDGSRFVKIGEGLAFAEVEIPRDADIWRLDFDNQNGTVKPFEFELDYTLPQVQQTGLFT